MKYRKKPVIIEALLLSPNEKSIREVLNFIDKPPLTECVQARDFFESYCDSRIKDNFIEIKTLEGVMKANFGDYIIKGVNGEFYPCKPDIFKKTYDKMG